MHRPFHLFVLALTTSLVAAPVLSQVTISDPASDHNFGRIPLGATYATQYFSAFNTGSSAVVLGTVTVDGEVATCLALGCSVPAPGDFAVFGSDGCSGRRLAPGEGCSTQIRFVPSAVGARTARLVVPVQGAAPADRVMSGTGVAQPIDCVLDWAERTFASLLTQPTPTFTVQAFHARCYQGGSLCIGADTALPTFAPASIYIYQAGQMARFAGLTELANQATQSPPSTRSCSQAAE